MLPNIAGYRIREISVLTNNSKAIQNYSRIFWTIYNIQKHIDKGKTKKTAPILVHIDTGQSSLKIKKMDQIRY